MELAILGIALNFVAFVVHVYWLDKDPTHEDVVITMMMLFCFVPYFVFVMEAVELFKQKVLHIHHGVRRK